MRPCPVCTAFEISPPSAEILMYADFIQCRLVCFTLTNENGALKQRAVKKLKTSVPNLVFQIDLIDGGRSADLVANHQQGLAIG
jgi:hypothetical protein